MIGKAGLAAVALVSLVAAGRAVDLRQLYDEMYPVDTLKRDAFNLCQQADPTFIRVLRDDREDCYDRMPHSIALAIGRIRPVNPLDGLFAGTGRFPGATFPPEDLYSRFGSAPPAGAYHAVLAGAGAKPCSGAPGAGLSPPVDPLRAAAAIDALADRGPASLAAMLTEMGLPTEGQRAANSRLGPPVVSGAANPLHPARSVPLPAAPAGLTPERPEAVVLLDSASGDLGDQPAAAAGCRERI